MKKSVKDGLSMRQFVNLKIRQYSYLLSQAVYAVFMTV